jgi:hypothetical protein
MSEQPPTNFGNVSEIATNAYSAASEGVENIKNTVSTSMSEFSSSTSNSLGNASSEFLQSNSIIAKIVFIFFVIILFNIFLRLGMFLLGYFSQINPNPYLIEGLIQGNQAIQVKQDPNDENSTTILLSNNEYTGIEFSWSVWLFLNDVGTTVTANPSKYSHIFHKGAKSLDTNNISTINNGPGVYLASTTDPTIRIIMDTVVSGSPAIVDINNIPLKKWFHLLIRMQNTSMDVYINGIVTSHVILDNVPKQNFQDVFLCLNGGFNGSLSNLRYYAHALDIFAINALVARGPNLKASTSPAVSEANPGSANKSGYSYLSSLWYTMRF